MPQGGWRPSLRSWRRGRRGPAPPSCRAVFLGSFPKQNVSAAKSGFVCLLETAVVRPWEEASTSKIAAAADCALQPPHPAAGLLARAPGSVCSPCTWDGGHLRFQDVFYRQAKSVCWVPDRLKKKLLHSNHDEASIMLKKKSS